MKITAVKGTTAGGLRGHLPARSVAVPLRQGDPLPSTSDPVERLLVDPELGGEGFTYELSSGAGGCVLIIQAPDYNEEPGYMRDLLLYKLTCEALDRLEASPLSKREIIRRLGTSPAQFYRLLDPTNYRKSVDKMLSLLQAQGCEVEPIACENSA